MPEKALGFAADSFTGRVDRGLFRSPSFPVLNPGDRGGGTRVPVSVGTERYYGSGRNTSIGNSGQFIREVGGSPGM